MKKSSIPSIIYTVLIFAFLYLPIGVLILYSFNSSDSTGVMEGFSFKWYKELFTDSATLTALRNTLVLAILSSVISTIIGTAAAYGISKMSNKHLKNATMSVTQIPMINPEIVTGISMMLLFVFVGGMIGSSTSLGFGTVLIAHITFNLPYVILLVLPKFKEMDKNLPEAARDLGCTPFQSFFKVELPAIMPGIVAGFIMAFTLSLDDFVISYFTTGSGFETLPIRIYSMTKKRVTPDMYALSTLIFVTILVLLLLSNLSNDKNKKEMSKRAKKVAKIAGGTAFGGIIIATIVLICVSAGTRSVTLNVYNWGEYISDGGEGSYNVNAEFEKWYEEDYYERTGEKIDVRINYTTYASNEDLYAKLKSGAGGYDVIIPSDYMLEKLKIEGLIQPLGSVSTIKEAIPNLEYLNPQFEEMFVYPNEKGELELYGAMYTYGVVGIVYNADKLAPEDLEKIEKGEMGWELIYGQEYMEKYKGQILQFNNSRDAFGTAMYHLGYNVNTATVDQWEEAYRLLQSQKPYVQGYVMDEIYNKMEGGEAAIAAYYAGDCLAMMENNESLGFFYPSKNNGTLFETNIFADAMCIPTGSQNKELALSYINFMLSEDAAVANAEYIYYSSPYDHVKENLDYQLYMGLYDYVYVLDENGEYILDENGEPLIVLDENGDPVYELTEDGGDYAVIYYSDFESSLKIMFDSYAYKDLDTAQGANITTSGLNDYWESLKVDSTSFGSSVYIVCAVILAVIIVIFVVYFVRKRRQRRYYWNNTSDPKPLPQVSVGADSDPLSETITLAAIRAQEKKQDANKEEHIKPDEVKKGPQIKTIRTDKRTTVILPADKIIKG
ncbi:MAG: extracellular solute-binding protein [Clostridia bacterium]|nr:extracellular solute-binding protein [Clostridia bacterium]